MKNPFDHALDQIVSSMKDRATSLDTMTDGVDEFDSKKLSPAEDRLMFDNPAAFYPGKMDPTTNMPLTNAQAAQRLLTEKGAQWYRKWVTDHAKKGVPTDG